MLQNLIPVLASQVMPQAVATGPYRSRCTAIESNGRTPGNQPDWTNPLPIAGLTNIPCMDAVPSTARIQATETKELQDIMSKAYRHVSLNGYYPAFFTDGSGGTGGQGLGWRVNVDGTIYDLLGAEPDSQGTQTRLMLQLVTI